MAEKAPEPQTQVPAAPTVSPAVGVTTLPAQAAGNQAVQRSLSATPKRSSPLVGNLTHGLSGPSEMQLESNTRIETEVRGELSIENRLRLVHERKIHIRTELGAEADVIIRSTTDLPFGYDPGADLEAALNLRGRTGIGYTLIGHLADGTPISGIGILESQDDSLAELANSGPEFLHFGLTPEQEYQAVVDALRNSVSEEVWRESEQKAQKRQREQQVQYPSQEEFERMSPEEKKDLAWRKFREEFNLGTVLKGILIGVAILIIAVLAVLAAEAGLVAVAIGLVAIAIIAAVVGLAFLVYNMIRDIAESWRRGDILGAILQFIKYAALIAAIIIGAIVLVVAIITALEGAVVILAGLAIAAIILLIVAVIAGIILVLMNLDRASDSDRVEDFQRNVERAAREAEEAVINLVLLIISFFIGPLARRLLPREGPSGARPPVEGEPPPAEGKRPRVGVPIEREGEIPLRISRGGTAEPVVLPNGRNGLRLTLPDGRTITVETLSRTRVPRGEVQRVRAPGGEEGDIFIEPGEAGETRWRTLTPEELEGLGRGESGIRGGRSRPAAPTDVPRQPDGSIDYAAWEQRLRTKGVRGELSTKIKEARAGNRDSEAELRLAESYIDKGFGVEIIKPEENAGIRNPDLRITHPSRGASRVDVKFREPGKPLTRNYLNDRISDANDQLSRSTEARGDVIIDATKAAPDSMTVPEIEAFLRGKLTGNRFAPRGAARLTNVEYLEIIYESGGRTHRSYMFRDANGDAHGPFTEILE